MCNSFQIISGQTSPRSPISEAIKLLDLFFWRVNNLNGQGTRKPYSYIKAREWGDNLTNGHRENATSCSGFPLSSVPGFGPLRLTGEKRLRERDLSSGMGWNRITDSVRLCNTNTSISTLILSICTLLILLNLHIFSNGYLPIISISSRPILSIRNLPIISIRTLSIIIFQFVLYLFFQSVIYLFFQFVLVFQFKIYLFL